MRDALRIAMILCLPLAPALAQDSTSTTTTWGDALLATDTSEQVNHYVVDLQKLTSSWGNEYRIAPLVKSSKIGIQYLNALMSGQDMSNGMLADVPFQSDMYYYWNAPQYGVNDQFNLMPTPMDTTGWKGNQFAVGFTDYGFADLGSGASSSNIVGALVNFKPAEPDRLYVTRVEAAVNIQDLTGSGFDNLDRSQFGFGAVDAHGNVHFRGDDNNASGPNLLIGEHYFRVNLPNRNPSAINLIDLLGTSMDPFPATCWVFNCPGCTQYSQSHSAPNIIPEQLGGPTMIGSNFGIQYVYETSGCPNPATTATGAHLAPGTRDQRGNLAFSGRLTCGNAAGTAAIVAYDINNQARVLNLFRVDAGGSLIVEPGSPIALDPTKKLGLAGGVFDGYHSTHSFRGGNGLVAVGEDQLGRGLAAATWYRGPDNQPPWFDIEKDPNNMILVCRFNCMDPNPDNAEWVIAAEATDAAATKVLDGPGGSAIAELTRRYSGGQYIGPSLSPPALDVVGNLYFLAPLQHYGADKQKGTVDDYYPYCLVRGVYDPASFNYELELLLESGSATASYGDVFRGLNSDRNYKITWITIAQAGGMLSSGSMFSGNLMQAAFNNMDPSELEPADPRTLGGLVLHVSVVYDANDDGVFEGGIGGSDEPYTLLLYIAGTGATGPQICGGDLNCDGVIDFNDINPFVLALSNWEEWKRRYPDCPEKNADVNEDGMYGGAQGFGDINPFVALLASGGGNPIPCP